MERLTFNLVESLSIFFLIFFLGGRDNIIKGLSKVRLLGCASVHRMPFYAKYIYSC